MIEISHELINYGHINDVLCCDCFYDEVYFMLRHKLIFQNFKERFDDDEKCYFTSIYGAAMIICHDVLHYANDNYTLFDRKKCMTEFENDIEFCSICIINLFREKNILHTFKLIW